MHPVEKFLRESAQVGESVIEPGLKRNLYVSPKGIVFVAKIMHPHGKAAYLSGKDVVEYINIKPIHNPRVAREAYEEIGFSLDLVLTELQRCGFEVYNTKWWLDLGISDEEYNEWTQWIRPFVLPVGEKPEHPYLLTMTVEGKNKITYTPVLPEDEESYWINWLDGEAPPYANVDEPPEWVKREAELDREGG